MRWGRLRDRPADCCWSETEMLDKLDLVGRARPTLQIADAGEELKAPPAGPALFEIGDCVMPRTAFAAM